MLTLFRKYTKLHLKESVLPLGFFRLLLILLFFAPYTTSGQTEELMHYIQLPEDQRSTYLLTQIEDNRYKAPLLANRLVELLLTDNPEKLSDRAIYAQGLYWSVWLKSRSSSFYSSYLYLLEEAKIASLIFEEQQMKLWSAKCYDLIAGIFLGQAANEPNTLSFQDSVILYLDLARRALKKSEEQQQKWIVMKADIAHTFALSLILRQETERADSNLKYALHLYDSIGDLGSRAKVLLNQMMYKSPSAAIPLYNEALEIYRDLRYPIDEADAYLCFLDYTLRVYQKQGNSTWLFLAEDAMRNHLNSVVTPSCEFFFKRGELFRLMAAFDVEIESLNLKAFYNFQNAFDYGKKNGNLPCANEATRKLVGLCGRIGKCELAYEQLAEEFFPAISQYIQASNSKLTAFQYSQINLKDRQRANRNITLISGIALLFLFALILYRQYTRNQKLQLAQEHTLALSEEKNQRIKMEEAARTARLNRHFILNGLNNIQGLINCNERKQANQYVTKLGRYIDEALMISDQPNVTLKQDIELHDLFITLYQYAFPSKLKSKSIELDPDLPTSEIRIPALIAQPDVENAILHGILNKSSPGSINLSIKRRGQNQIDYIIEDDGVGLIKAAEIRQQKSRSRPSMGTNIVMHALKTLNQKNKVPFDEERSHPLGAYRNIESLVYPDGTNAGTRVVITLPYQLIIETL